MSRDLVLLTADSLRFDFISYFNPDSEARTPNIDELASEGVACHSNTSNGPHTVLSAPSILSGEYQPAITAETPTVAELLSESGYDTAAFCANILIPTHPQLEPMSLTRGFDVFDTLHNPLRENSELYVERLVYKIAEVARTGFGEESLPYWGITSTLPYLPLPIAKPSPSAEQVNDRLLEWLDDAEREDGPCFVWAFYLDTHEPWLPPQSRDDGDGALSGKLRELYRHGVNRKFRYFKESLSEREVEKLKQMYVESVEYWDEQVGELVEALRTREDIDPTIVITSDHGELFGERGEYGHCSEPWEPLLRTPLILNGPDVPSKDVRRVTQNLDVPSTLADLAGVETPETFRGRSLSALTDGDVNRSGCLAVFDTNPLKVSYRTDEWKYVDRAESRSLHRVEGMSESEDCTEDHREVALRLRSEVDDVLRDVPAVDRSEESEAPTATLEGNLRALGYLDEKS